EVLKTRNTSGMRRAPGRGGCAISRPTPRNRAAPPPPTDETQGPPGGTVPTPAGWCDKRLTPTGTVGLSVEDLPPSPPPGAHRSPPTGRPNDPPSGPEPPATAAGAHPPDWRTQSAASVAPDGSAPGEPPSSGHLSRHQMTTKSGKCAPWAGREHCGTGYPARRG